MNSLKTFCSIQHSNVGLYNGFVKAFVWNKCQHSSALEKKLLFVKILLPFYVVRRRFPLFLSFYETIVKFLGIAPCSEIIPFLAVSVGAEMLVMPQTLELRTFIILFSIVVTVVHYILSRQNETLVRWESCFIKLIADLWRLYCHLQVYYTHLDQYWQQLRKW